MASEVDRLMIKNTGINPHLSQNHIRCFCHKITLIINAGLKSTQLPTSGLLPSQVKNLGFVPILAPIIEESEEIEEVPHFTVEDVILGVDDNHQVEHEANDEDVIDGMDSADLESWEKAEEGKNPLDKILKKVDFVIQRITSSAVKRSEYKTWSQKLEIDGPSLIAGYGIYWNIKFESRTRAYQACRIIKKLIENEKDRQEQEGGKNYYNNTKISRDEWEVVNQLNKILGEFYFITKKMEGDNSSACLMISEYQHIITFIKKILSSSTQPEFKTTLAAMLKKTRPYLNEAMKCDAVLIATILNPSFRLSIFKVSFPSHYDYAHDLIYELFETRNAQVNITLSSLPDESAELIGTKEKATNRDRED
ncbi:hypothetical protein PGT21_015090 [Puccinia graminis f. sp. tritici]|uniref:hAT-like transposase RNase-H fold domain-containing protein n=1 Tax=Puccinia graminis f. sp. tritici TaxID=56615 RepID=A0A5B0Q2Z0_PUCGR|nr:hypothetical protein PGT21_015090 [Puccinia graminis f. sp. tritici]KAA1124717.1 hypothetical protein PGTUg99_032506 [Puccinia graminis f. sp. tritici]